MFLTITALAAYSSTVFASHLIDQNCYDQYDQFNYIAYCNGWSWNHPSSAYGQGYAQTAGIPYYSSTYDHIEISFIYTYTSCNKGSTWNYQAGAGAQHAYNVNTLFGFTPSYLLPGCDSSPKYRTDSRHYWQDGAFSTSRNYYWHTQ